MQTISPSNQHTTLVDSSNCDTSDPPESHHHFRLHRGTACVILYSAPQACMQNNCQQPDSSGIQDLRPLALWKLQWNDRWCFGGIGCLRRLLWDDWYGLGGYGNLRRLCEFEIRQFQVGLISQICWLFELNHLCPRQWWMFHSGKEKKEILSLSSFIFIFTVPTLFTFRVVSLWCAK